MSTATVETGFSFDVTVPASPAVMRPGEMVEVGRATYGDYTISIDMGGPYNAAGCLCGGCWQLLSRAAKVVGSGREARAERGMLVQARDELTTRVHRALTDAGWGIERVPCGVVWRHRTQPHFDVR